MAPSYCPQLAPGCHLLELQPDLLRVFPLSILLVGMSEDVTSNLPWSISSYCHFRTLWACHLTPPPPPFVYFPKPLCQGAHLPDP